jgi:hypothetical protein
MTASEHTELLPCPLCGGKAEVIFVTGMAYDWRARCANPNCGANVRFTANSPLEDDPRRAAVIAAWNKRATHDPESVADAARLMVDAWDVLPEGRHSISVMQKWILDDLKPAVARIRVALASRAPDGAEPVPVAWPGGDFVEYSRVHNIAISAYEAAIPPDYRYSAAALRKAVDAAITAALHPTRETTEVGR